MAKVLVVGGGAREHALAWAIAKSPNVGDVFVAPGNAGTSQGVHNVHIDSTDVVNLVSFAKATGVGLVVVGPENALAAGVVDACCEQQVPVLGPSRAAARIETSKALAKKLMERAGIPTAAFRVFRDYEGARRHVSECRMPIVVKASGLASGKGVVICRTRKEAEAALYHLLREEGHSKVIVEALLDGQEVSVHALHDGKTTVMWPLSQDHKQAWEGGPMTGGMGAIAPVPWVTSQMMGDVQRQIVDPALAELARMGSPFTGCLYPGLMRTPRGLMVLEYNARLGDPEAQVYMRLMASDLYELLLACAEGRLSEARVEWRPGFAVCIVLASGGYPGKYEVGFPIEGIARAEKVPGVVVFHAGTAFRNGQLVTAGGRVLSVTAVGATLQEALDSAYQAAELISFEGMWYRRDIGRQALSHELRS